MADLGFGPEVSVGDDAIRVANSTRDLVLHPSHFAATPVVGDRAVVLAPGAVQAAAITSPGYGELTAEETVPLPFTGSMTYQGKLICRELEWLDSQVAPGGESRTVVLDAGDYASWPDGIPDLDSIDGFTRRPGELYHVPLHFGVVRLEDNVVRLWDARDVDALVLGVFGRATADIFASSWSIAPLNLSNRNRGGFELSDGRVRVPMGGLYSVDIASRIEAKTEGRRMLRLLINGSTTDRYGRTIETSPIKVSNTGSLWLQLNNVELLADDELTVECFTEHRMNFTNVRLALRREAALI